MKKKCAERMRIKWRYNPAVEECKLYNPAVEGCKLYNPAVEGCKLYNTTLLLRNVSCIICLVCK